MYHTSAKNRAPALTACAVVDWANLKFEKTFKFRDDTCGAKHLKDFWATTGTFITALFSSGMFRTVIDFFTRKIFAIISGAPPPAEAPKGMEAGAHELHIIKTSHLGLCQAMGALLCVAKYTGCPCGWLNRALWSMWHGMFQTPLQGRAVKARGSALALGLLLTVLSAQTAAAQSGCVWGVPAIHPYCALDSFVDFDGATWTTDTADEHCAQFGFTDDCCICNARPTLSELQSTLPSLCKVTALEHEHPQTRV
jgi:hypothetical protein